MIVKKTAHKLKTQCDSSIREKKTAVREWYNKTETEKHKIISTEKTEKVKHTITKKKCKQPQFPIIKKRNKKRQLAFPTQLFSYTFTFIDQNFTLPRQHTVVRKKLVPPPAAATLTTSSV